MMRTMVIAIGGNSLIADKEHQSVSDQYRACVGTCHHLAPLLRDPKLRLVITHGNGPQVGFILRRSELTSKELHAVPIDTCVAETQGAIGYQIQLALLNEFKRLGIEKTAATVVTLCHVDRSDPAFRKLTKPIGSFMSKEQAEQHSADEGWDVMEDAGRGWRRVVASPAPTAIVEISAVKSLLEAGFVAIAAGGGGIAVVENDAGEMIGAAAVIDKDFTSSLLARQLGAQLFVCLTAVDKVYLAFGTPQQQGIDRMNLAEARRYMAEGHFKAGSMLPKIEAVISFLDGGGREAIITDPPHLGLALVGRAGTLVVP
jgi:carbamate kinase